MNTSETYKSVSDSKQVDSFVGTVRDPNRRLPIVVLTSRMGETEPSLDAEMVGEWADPGAVVVVVSDVGAQWRLRRELGPKVHSPVDGAAMIWWPPRRDGAQSDEIPVSVVVDKRKVYGRRQSGQCRN